MQQIVECVPNFSEGRRPEVIDAIVATIAAVPGRRCWTGNPMPRITARL